MAGKSSAVADVAAQAGPDQGRSVAHTLAPADGGQADLLGFDQELSLFEDQAIAPPARRGPGRPVGSVNRTTLQLQKLLMAKGYRDPAEFLASIVSMDVRVLAGELSEPRKADDDKGVEVMTVHRGAALQLQLRAAEALMPYFHQKMPIAVEHTGDGARPLIIIRDGESVRITPAIDGRAMSVHDVAEVQQDQGLSGSAPAMSHGDATHDEPNDE